MRYSCRFVDNPCMCHRDRYRHELLDGRVSPLQDLLWNDKYYQFYGGVTLPFFPDRTTPDDLKEAAPSSPAQAYLVNNFAINLRHLVGAEMSISA